MITLVASLANVALLVGGGGSSDGDLSLCAESLSIGDASAAATTWSVSTLAMPTLTDAYLPLSSIDVPALSVAALPAFGLAPRYVEDRKDDGRNNYLIGKVGELYPAEGELSTGWMVGAAYGRYFTRLLSLEVEASYSEPDVDSSPSSADMYAVPLMVNGRINLPIWILQMYGGLGIGGIYYNVDGGSFDGDGWLTAGSAFIGADVTLLDRLSAGLELKYYVTDEMRNSSVNLDMFVFSLTVGFRF